MREKTSLGGRFTFAGTSLTVNRLGYGAMQLAGRDGDKLVWGPPRDIPGAIAGAASVRQPSTRELSIPNSAVTWTRLNSRR